LTHGGPLDIFRRLQRLADDPPVKDSTEVPALRYTIRVAQEHHRRVYSGLFYLGRSVVLRPFANATAPPSTWMGYAVGNSETEPA
jgi:hypothetical protein